MIALLLLSALNPGPSLDAEAAWTYAAQSGTQAMIVSQNGKIVFERYANGGSEAIRLPMASGSKSFHGVLLAALVDDGKLAFDQKVGSLLPEWREGEKGRATLSDVLSLSSGLASPRREMRGTWQAAIDAPLSASPGEKFQYGSYPFFVFGAAVEKALPGKPYVQTLNERLLEPLGIAVRWGSLEDGNPQLAGAGRILPRDWVVFGEFIRNGGRHNGRQIVRAESLDRLFKGTSANPRYGLTWWLGEAPDADGPQPARREGRPAVPSVMAAGLGKQRLYVSKELGLVVLRMGPLNGGRQFDDQSFMTALIKRA